MVLLRLCERRGLLRYEGLDLARRGLQLALQLARDLVGLLHRGTATATATETEITQSSWGVAGRLLFAGSDAQRTRAAAREGGL